MSEDLSAPRFTNEEEARKYFETIRWPDGRSCPHCGIVEQSTLLKGKSHRPGLYQCNACKKPFSAIMGTLCEKSHFPLHKWLLATHLKCSSKKGISAHQLGRTLGFGSYRTAWFMANRIREGMKGGGASDGPLGSGGGTVEVDETFIGHDPVDAPMPDAPKRPGNMNKILSLVDRTSGEARSFVVKDLRLAKAGEALKHPGGIKEARLALLDAARLYEGVRNDQSRDDDKFLNNVNGL